MLVHAIRPLVNRHHVATLLVHGPITRLVHEHAAVQTGDLALAHIRHLQVRVQQQIERERQVLARIVDADMEVELFLAYDQPIGYPERVVPHGAREIVVHQAEQRLDVAVGQTLGRPFERPARDARESVLRPERPGSELSCWNFGGLDLATEISLTILASPFSVCLYLRNTNGMPPRIAFLPSKTASLLRKK